VGVEQVGLSRKALENIILEVEVASEQISDIAEAVEKQSIGIEDVNNAVRSIDRSAQTNAASLEEMTASSMALNEEASTLTKALGHFHGVSEHAVPKDQDSLTSEDSVPAEALATRPTKIAVNGGSAVPASDGWDEF
jgi:methyl-accepting chemotaxis protein